MNYKDNIFYVYAHYDSEGNIKYIGKGHGKRAFEKSDRSVFWKRFFSKHNLVIKILCCGLKESEAFEHECAYIEHYKKMGQCDINMTTGGEGTSGVPCKEENKIKARNRMLKNNPMKIKAFAEKMAKTKTGRTLTEEHKKKIGLASIGNKHSLGVFPSEETRKKISEKLKGEKHPLFGKHHSEESKRKMSEKQKNRSPETLQKMRDAKKNISDETRKKISIARTGKKLSQESIAKREATKKAKRMSTIDGRTYLYKAA